MQNYLYCSWVYSVSHAGAPCTISQYTDHIHGICPMLSGSSPFLLATVMCVLAVTAGSSHTGTRWEAGTGRSQWKGCKKLRLAHSPNKWIFLEKNPLVSVQVFPLGCLSWPLSQYCCSSLLGLSGENGRCDGWSTAAGESPVQPLCGHDKAWGLCSWLLHGQPVELVLSEHHQESSCWLSLPHLPAWWLLCSSLFLLCFPVVEAGRVNL